MNARQITSDIRWIMEDNRLDRAQDFKVQTKKDGDSWVTVVYGANAHKVEVALVDYLLNRPQARTFRRVFDGYLAVAQPMEES